jgi:hypothetical protein
MIFLLQNENKDSTIKLKHFYLNISKTLHVLLIKMSYQVISKNMSYDILKIIFEYDGRWKYRNGNWVSIFHIWDERYNLLNKMIIWRKSHKYARYSTIDVWYRPEIHNDIPYKHHISYIFPIKSEKVIEKYIHISKTICYNVDDETDKPVYKSKFNRVRAFMSHNDDPRFDFSSDYYSSDAYEDHFMEGEVYEDDTKTITSRMWQHELSPYYEFWLNRRYYRDNDY